LRENERESEIEKVGLGLGVELWPVGALQRVDDGVTKEEEKKKKKESRESSSDSEHAT
jgi:hypothetical protein